nr:hypothetical protein L204_05319 [Cryptococcus depauperatus CBS 7855]
MSDPYEACDLDNPRNSQDDYSAWDETSPLWTGVDPSRFPFAGPSSALPWENMTEQSCDPTSHSPSAASQRTDVSIALTSPPAISEKALNQKEEKNLKQSKKKLEVSWFDNGAFGVRQPPNKRFALQDRESQRTYRARQIARINTAEEKADRLEKENAKLRETVTKQQTEITFLRRRPKSRQRPYDQQSVSMATAPSTIPNQTSSQHGSVYGGQDSRMDPNFSTQGNVQGQNYTFIHRSVMDPNLDQFTAGVEEDLAKRDA